MIRIIPFFGICAAIVLLVVSAAMNWRFGFTLGKTELDGQIYGAASVAADVLKALSPFFIVWAFRNRNYGQALSGLAILCVCALYSLASSIGFASFNRAETIGERALHAQQYKSHTAELKQVKEKLKWIPQHRAVSVVKADIDALYAQPVYIRRQLAGTVKEVSVECTKATWVTRKRCGEILDLNKELAIAQQALALQVRKKTIQKNLSRISKKGGAVVAGADPQAAFISKILGLDLTDTQTVLTLMISILVEVGSSLGLLVSFSRFKAESKEGLAITPIEETAVVQEETEVMISEPMAKETETVKSVPKKRLGYLAYVRKKEAENVVKFPKSQLTAKQKHKLRQKRKNQKGKLSPLDLTDTDLKSFIKNNYARAEEKPKGARCDDYYSGQEEIYQNYLKLFPDDERSQALGWNAYKKAMVKIVIDGHPVGRVVKSNNKNYYKLRKRNAVELTGT